MAMTAIQKIRLRLTGDPYGEPHFQHEGPNIIRWLTGGSAPDAHVTFQHEGIDIITLCPKCHQELGRFDGSYTGPAFRQLGGIREAFHEHQQEH